LANANAMLLMRRCAIGKGEGVEREPT
jgi:hypothetical protein